VTSGEVTAPPGRAGRASNGLDAAEDLVRLEDETAGIVRRDQAGALECPDLPVELFQEVHALPPAPAIERALRLRQPPDQLRLLWTREPQITHLRHQEPDGRADIDPHTDASDRVVAHAPRRPDRFDEDVQLGVAQLGREPVAVPNSTGLLGLPRTCPLGSCHTPVSTLIGPAGGSGLRRRLPSSRRAGAPRQRRSDTPSDERHELGRIDPTPAPLRRERPLEGDERSLLARPCDLGRDHDSLDRLGSEVDRTAGPGPSATRATSTGIDWTARQEDPRCSPEFAA